MENIQINWTKPLKTNFLFMKVVGVLPVKSTSNYSRRLWKFYQSFYVIVAVIMPIMLQTIKLISTTEMDTFISVVAFQFQQYCILGKMFCFKKNMLIFEQLLEYMNKESMFQPRNSRQRKIVLRGLLLWKKVFVVLSVAAILTLTAWIMSPVLDNLTKEHELLYPIWFPFDYTVSPYYEFGYFYESLSLFSFAHVTINIDLIIFALMNVISIQCDLLCDNLISLEKSNRDVNKLEKEFRRCIEHHKKILKFSANCINFFFGIVSLEILSSAVSIGLAMLYLTVLPAFTTEFYSIMGYAVTITFAMSLYCWFGNYVLAQSNNIPYSAFRMNFLNAPLSVKKSLIIFITRTQNPIKIPIMNISFLTMEAFVKILRTAWSYFTVLRQLTGSE